MTQERPYVELDTGVSEGVVVDDESDKSSASSSSSRSTPSVGADPRSRVSEGRCSSVPSSSSAAEAAISWSEVSICSSRSLLGSSTTGSCLMWTPLLDEQRTEERRKLSMTNAISATFSGQDDSLRYTIRHMFRIATQTSQKVLKQCVYIKGLTKWTSACYLIKLVEIHTQ